MLNAGIPGTDTWQHEILLRRLLPATRPHAVVLAVYVNGVVPRHDVGNAQASTLTNTWRKRLAYLLKRSSVVTWCQHILLPWYARAIAGNDPAEDPVISGWADPRTERGWWQVERSLAEMKGLCDARGIGFLVAVLPRRDQFSGGHAGRAHNDRTLGIAQAYGILGLDLLPPLAAEYRVHRARLFIPWDGHNAAVANRVIATEIANAVPTLIAARASRAAPTIIR